MLKKIYKKEQKRKRNERKSKKEKRALLKKKSVTKHSLLLWFEPITKSFEFRVPLYYRHSHLHA